MRQYTESGFEKALKRVMTSFRWIILIAFIVLLCTGIFRVESDEVAMILRMGQLVGSTPEEQILQPGLHFALPYVIDEVVRVPVGKIRETTVSTHNSSGIAIARAVNRAGYLLTGDNNIVLMEAVVKYQITDPIAFALECADPEQMINTVVSGEMVAYVNHMDVDTVLTTGKARLAEDVKRSAQVRLDAANCGVTLTNIELTRVDPPSEVKADFEAVNAAAVRKNTLIQSANEYRESLIPSAEATARKYVETASAQQQTLTARATSEIAVFDGLVDQYAISPSAVYDSYLRSRVAAVIRSMSVYVVDDAEQSPQMIIP